MDFYLGLHHPNHMADPRLADVPAMISRNRLVGRKTFPRPAGRYVIDSGGFTLVKKHGHYPVTPEQYVSEVRTFIAGMGHMPDWVAPQDWMCEPWVITGKNWHLADTKPAFFHGTRAARGLAPTRTPGDDEQDFDAAVLFHQERTVENALILGRIAPDLPWLYSLQGWTLDQYKRCADMYEAAGVDLGSAPIVGLGSVCRREATAEIGQIVETFHTRGWRLHGFGVKTQGLERYGHMLASADSAAWSFGARNRPPMPGHEGRHKNCANCLEAGLGWRTRLLAKQAAPTTWQPSLFDLEFA